MFRQEDGAVGLFQCMTEEMPILFLHPPPLSPHARKKYKLDTLGFARRALRMRSGCDASTS